MADVYMPDINGLRLAGLHVNGLRRAVRLILTGDYSFLTAWCGHLGASSRMPCLECTAMRRRTATNGELVDKYGDMQAGSRAGGTLRTGDQFAKMAAAYATGNNDTLPVRLTLEQHLSIERRPLMVIPPDNISSMPLHLTLGITVWLLQLSD